MFLSVSPTNNRALIIACACVGSLVFSLAVLVLIWWICKRYKPCKKRRKLKLNQNGWEEGKLYLGLGGRCLR